MKHLFLLLILSVLPFVSFASSEGKGDDPHHSPLDHRNHFALFGGYSLDMHNRVGPKIGLEYVRRMTNLIALRGALDYTGKDFKDYSLSATVDFSPFKEVPLSMGAGLGAKHYHEEWNPFGRILVSYDFDIGQFSLSPLIIYDIYDQKNYLTFGLGFGIGF